MGLIGSFTLYNSIQTGTKTVEQRIPEFMPPEHHLYDRRGEVYEEEVPIFTVESSSYDNAYVNIKATVIEKIAPDETFGILEEDIHMNVTYEIFESKEARTLDPSNYLLRDNLKGAPINLSTDNIIEKAYEYVMELEQFVNMVRD